MKFVTNTKPLYDAVNLGIINSNVSKFYQKSCIVQLQAFKSSLKINIEANQIITELVVKGSGDSDNSNVLFVDSLMLKQLLSTLDSSTITLSFEDSGLTIESGKSKFTLPKLIEDNDMELSAPKQIDNTLPVSEIDIAKWKYIKDKQLFAIAMSFVNPVYTFVWLGDNKDVIVGDMDNSIFTHTTKSDLPKGCLLSDTIINLFTTLPQGAKLQSVNNEYIISIVNDSYTYTSQLFPKYEDDEIGSYNSDMILALFQPSSHKLSINPSDISKFLSQANLLISGSDASIVIEYANNKLNLYSSDKSVDTSFPVKGECFEFSLPFNLNMLKSVFSNFSDDTVELSPTELDGQVSGVVIRNADLAIVISGVDE